MNDDELKQRIKNCLNHITEDANEVARMGATVAQQILFFDYVLNHAHIHANMIDYIGSLNAEGQTNENL